MTVEFERSAFIGADPVEVAISRFGAAALERRVQGQWLVEPFFQPSPAERIFSTPFLIVHVERQGCAYFASESLPEVRMLRLVGRTVSDCLDELQAARIAVVDAVQADTARLDALSVETVPVRGTVTAKARARAVLVRREVLHHVGPRAKTRVGLIGYSGEIAMQLAVAGCQVWAYDLDPAIVAHLDQSLEAPVAHGDAFYGHDRFDIVVASGMTLVTKTFRAIAANCHRAAIPLLMYCQTGANLGAILVECGASGVVAEHLPFYNWEGESRMSVYRA